MPTRTITLELDAYERLRSSKRPGESFSQVVRRAIFSDFPPKGTELLAYFRAGGTAVSQTYLNAVEQAAQDDQAPDNPWT